MPSAHRITMGRTFVSGHIVRDEIHIAPVLEPQRTTFGLVELYCLTHQVAVRDHATRGYLFFAPPVQQITGSRRTLEARFDLGGLPFDEQLCLLVTRVMDNREIEPQPSIDVAW